MTVADPVSAAATPALRGYALAIVQDPVDPDLLFLGTEFGLWVSLDGGKGWTRWSNGFPTVSVMDLAIQPRDSDLIVATHGRALWIVIRAFLAGRSIEIFATDACDSFRRRYSRTRMSSFSTSA